MLLNKNIEKANIKNFWTLYISRTELLQIYVSWFSIAIDLLDESPQKKFWNYILIFTKN